MRKALNGQNGTFTISVAICALGNIICNLIGFLTCLIYKTKGDIWNSNWLYEDKPSE